MLRRRDLKGQDENNEPASGVAQPPVDQVHTEEGQATAGDTQAVTSNSNISPGGLAWRPMRQQSGNEDWRPQRAPGSTTGEESIIGPDDFFNGHYRSERGVRVQGRVEGAVESKGHILIEEQAQVSADMTAEDITVAGRFNGKVECRRRFEITPSGVVTGEINTDLLVVQEGGYFDGKLKMKDRSGTGRAPAAQRSADATSATDEDQGPAQV